MIREYRVVRDYANQGEDLSYEIMLCTIKTNNGIKRVTNWEAISPLYSLNSVQRLKENTENEMKEIMKAFDKPVLVICHEKLV